MAKCNEKTEVYSRVCGYHRPVTTWNVGKREEFSARRTFKIPTTAKLSTPAPPTRTGPPVKAGPRGSIHAVGRNVA